MLRLAELHGDLVALAQRQVAEQDDRARWRSRAQAAYQDYAGRPEWWAARLAGAETKLHLAEFSPELGTTTDPPPAPPEYTVLATDGSQIYPDRHGAALWFVLNIGRVRLSYGRASSAELSARPRLYAEEGDVFRGVLGQRQTITTDDVAVLRGLEELRALLELARAEASGRPTLALLDGKLIPWSWAHADEGFALQQLSEYAALLAEFEQLGVAVASYISRSGANEVTNLVRLGDCPQRPAVCARCPHLGALRARIGSETMSVEQARELPCGAAAGLVDGDLFGGPLAPGQRSPLFFERNRASARIGLRAGFFYLAVEGGELARIELPEWAARQPAVVSLTHAVIGDQLAKGQGYPVALREAHEQAVIRSADRLALMHLLDHELARRGRTVRFSNKSRSKQAPAV